MKKTVLLLLALFVFMTSASAADVASSVTSVKTSSTYSAPDGYEPKGYVGNIISQIFDPVGQILSNYVIAFRNIFDTDNTVPVWNATTKVFDVGTITDTGTNVGIGVTSPSEKLSVAGRLSITGNPNSDDDVGDRGYNDGRYVNVGESINGDDIQDGTIDSSEIENNTLTSSDLAPNSVGNSELNNSQVFSMAGLNLNGKAKMIQGGSYDLWIQGGTTDTGGNARNLAILGSKSNDQLRINYGGEYTGGTRFDGNVGIGTSSPETLLQIGDGLKLGEGGINGDSELGADIEFTGYGLTISQSGMEFIIDSDNSGTGSSFKVSNDGVANNSTETELFRIGEDGHAKLQWGSFYKIGTEDNGGFNGFGAKQLPGNALETIIASRAGVSFVMDTNAGEAGSSFSFGKRKGGSGGVDGYWDTEGFEELVRIKHNGNVGIGTSTPGNKLDVDGKIRMRGGTQDSDEDNIVATKGYVDSLSSTTFTRITGEISSRNISTALNLTSDVTFYAADQDTANFLCREQLGLQFGFWRTKGTPTNSGWRPYSNLEISSYSTDSENGLKRLCTSGSDCYNKKTQFGRDLYCYSFDDLPAPSGY